ncbi:MBL fold metallo-hydrolase [Longitalea arenae]|uniref:MBL fold metallo-hydrolase n=1 Tax=Longitalea arenae TaxID=2812558 RepID=UPI00196864AB|nr:MBL fold metallo-hydrolase [Longitalea arenae]
MEQSSDNRLIPMTSFDSGKLREVAPDVAYYTNQIVNIVMIGMPGNSWVLIDAGMPKSGNEILKMLAERFGANNPPAAIILTHGHFDHVGSIVALLEKWNVPVYAHPMEFPYLTGERAYPEPDTSVQGGILAKISSLYPNEPVDITQALTILPADGTLPTLPDWKWIHVPGHTPGQIALFRERDRILISADAIITVRQDSLYRVLMQKEEVCGPPVYLTTDWDAAYESVKRLAALGPNTIIAGHGTAMQGEDLREGLDHLITHWNEVAVPDHGKWVNRDDL